MNPAEYAPVMSGLQNSSAAVTRIDLHCHSLASSLTAETVLNAIHCPACYSDPAEVYAQAKRRGMGRVTINGHDKIEVGVAIAVPADVIVGEELTFWVSEDQCKMQPLW